MKWIPIFVLLASSVLWSAESIRIGSWNIEHLGNKNKRSGIAKGIEQSPADLAEYIAFSKVDILGLIEIKPDSNNRHSSAILKQAFELINSANPSGNKWEFYIFDTPRAQCCGIAWNNKKVKKESFRAVNETGQTRSFSYYPINLDYDSIHETDEDFGESVGNVWHRHPHLMKFRAKGSEKKSDILISVLQHKADYEGDFAAQRNHEAQELSGSVQYLKNIDNDIVLIGDVNAKGTNEACNLTYKNTGFKDLNQADLATHWRYGPLDRAFVPSNQPEFSHAEIKVLKADFLSAKNLTEADFKKLYSDHFLIHFDLEIMSDDD